MVNSQIVAETVNVLKLDIQKEVIPNPVPVVEVGIKTVKNGISRSNVIANTTTATIYTTPTTQDFYLTGACLTFVRDATATSTSFAINYTDEFNQAQAIISFAGVTLNLGYGSVTTPPFHPIKLAKNSTVTITSSSNTANFKASGTIYGFIDELQ